MKKLILLAALIIVTGATVGQTMQKGNVIGSHSGIVILDPDVTYNQWKDYAVNQFIPAFNKRFEGEISLYLAEGKRGDEKNRINFIWVFKSLEIRDKYFTKEGEYTQTFRSKFKKIQPMWEKLNKLGEYSNKRKTDWLIQ